MESWKPPIWINNGASMLANEINWTNKVSYKKFIQTAFVINPNWIKGRREGSYLDRCTSMCMLRQESVLLSSNQIKHAWLESLSDDVAGIIPLAAEQINTNQNGDQSLCRRGCSMDNSPEIRNPKCETWLNRPVVDFNRFFFLLCG